MGMVCSTQRSKADDGKAAARIDSAQPKAPVEKPH